MDPVGAKLGDRAPGKSSVVRRILLQPLAAAATCRRTVDPPPAHGWAWDGGLSRLQYLSGSNWGCHSNHVGGANHRSRGPNALICARALFHRLSSPRRFCAVRFWLGPCHQRDQGIEDVTRGRTQGHNTGSTSCRTRARERIPCLGNNHACMSWEWWEMKRTKMVADGMTLTYIHHP